MESARGVRGPLGITRVGMDVEWCQEGNHHGLGSDGPSGIASLDPGRERHFCARRRA